MSKQFGDMAVITMILDTSKTSDGATAEASASTREEKKGEGKYQAVRPEEGSKKTYGMKDSQSSYEPSEEDRERLIEENDGLIDECLGSQGEWSDMKTYLNDRNVRLDPESVRTITRNISTAVAEKIVENRKEAKFDQRVFDWYFSKTELKTVQKKQALAGTWWQEEKLVVRPLIYGEAFDEVIGQVVFEETKTFLELDGEIYRYAYGPINKLDDEQAINANDLPGSAVMQVLVSRFSRNALSVSQDMASKILRHKLRAPTAVYNQLKGARNVFSKMNVLKKAGMIGDVEKNDIFDRAMIIELLDNMSELAYDKLKKKLVDFATITSCMVNSQDANGMIFSFKCRGTSMCNLVVGSEKKFKIAYVKDNRDVLAMLHLEVCEKMNWGVELQLTVVGQVSMTAKAVLELFSSLKFSMGSFSASNKEIMQIQDAAWGPMMEIELDPYVQLVTAYCVRDVANLVPLMALAVLKPDVLEDFHIRMAWCESVAFIVANLCGTESMLGDVMETEHFESCILESLAMMRGDESNSELRKFVVQVFLWAKIRKEDPIITYVDVYRGPRVIKQMHARRISAQVLWVATCLLEPSELNELGYSSIPFIAFYNYLVTKRACLKNVGLGIWLSSCFNLAVDREAEDIKLVANCRMLGMTMSQQSVDRIRCNDNVSHKICATLEIMSDWLEPIGMVLDTKVLNMQEASTVVKVARSNTDITEERSSAFGEYSEKAISEIFAKLAEGVSRGIFSESDVSSLVSRVISAIDSYADRSVNVLDPDSMVSMINEEIMAMRIRNRMLESGKSMEEVSAVINELSKRKGLEKKKTLASEREDESARQMVTKSSGPDYNRIEAENVISRYYAGRAASAGRLSKSMLIDGSSVSDEGIKDLSQLTESFASTASMNVGSFEGREVSASTSFISDGKSSYANSATLAIGGRELASLSVGNSFFRFSKDKLGRSKGVSVSLLDGVRLDFGSSVIVDFAKVSATLDSIVSGGSETYKKIQFAKEIESERESIENEGRRKLLGKELVSATDSDESRESTEVEEKKNSDAGGRDNASTSGERTSVSGEQGSIRMDTPFGAIDLDKRAAEVGQKLVSLGKGGFEKNDDSQGMRLSIRDYIRVIVDEISAIFSYDFNEDAEVERPVMLMVIVVSTTIVPYSFESVVVALRVAQDYFWDKLTDVVNAFERLSVRGSDDKARHAYIVRNRASKFAMRSMWAALKYTTLTYKINAQALIATIEKCAQIASAASLGLGNALYEFLNDLINRTKSRSLLRKKRSEAEFKPTGKTTSENKAGIVERTWLKACEMTDRCIVFVVDGLFTIADIPCLAVEKISEFVRKMYRLLRDACANMRFRASESSRKAKLLSLGLARKWLNRTAGPAENQCKDYEGAHNSSGSCSEGALSDGDKSEKEVEVGPEEGRSEEIESLLAGKGKRKDEENRRNSSEFSNPLFYFGMPEERKSAGGGWNAAAENAEKSGVEAEEATNVHEGEIEQGSESVIESLFKKTEGDSFFINEESYGPSREGSSSKVAKSTTGEELIDPSHVYSRDYEAESETEEIIVEGFEPAEDPMKPLGEQREDETSSKASEDSRKGAREEAEARPVEAAVTGNIIIKSASRKMKEMAADLVSSTLRGESATRKGREVVNVTSVQNDCSGGHVKSDNLECLVRGDRALLDDWEYSNSTSSSRRQCSLEDHLRCKVELVARDDFIIHLRGAVGSSYAARGEMDIIDADGISVLIMADYSSIMKSIETREESEVKTELGDTANRSSYCSISKSIGRGRVMKGSLSVVQNYREEEEVIMTASHLVSFGLVRQNYELYDDTACLAWANARGDIPLNSEEYEAKDEESEAEGEDDERVVARRFPATSSSKYFFAVTEAKNWKGKSGSVVYDKLGNPKGILVLQLFEGGDYEMIKGSSLIVCSRIMKRSWPIVISNKPKILVCKSFADRACEISTGVSIALREMYGSNVDRTCGEEFGEGIERITEETVKHKLAIADMFIKEHMKNKEEGPNRLKLIVNNAMNSLEVRGLSKACISNIRAVADEIYVLTREILQQAYDIKMIEVPEMMLASLRTAGKMIAAGSYPVSWIVRNRLGASTLAIPTGILLEACKASIGKRERREGVCFMENELVHNILEFTSYGERKFMGECSKAVLDEVRRSIVRDEKLVIICVSNNMSLSVGCLLASIGCRYDKVTTLSDLKRRLTGKSSSKSSRVALMIAEDLLVRTSSNFVSGDLGCRKNSRLLILAQDDEMSKTVSTICSKVACLYTDEIAIYLYERGREMREEGFNIESQSTGSCQRNSMSSVLTPMIKDWQNSGRVTMVSVDNYRVQECDANDRVRHIDKPSAKYVIISETKEAKVMRDLAHKTSKLLGLETDDVVVMSPACFALINTWKVIRNCRGFIFNSGTVTDTARQISFVCMLDYLVSEEEVNTLMDSQRVSSIFFGDSRLAENTKSIIMPDKNRPSVCKMDDKVISLDSLRGSSTSRQSIADIEAIINNTQVKGDLLCLNPRSLNDILMKVSCNSGMKKMEILDVHAVGRRISEEKRKNLSLMELAKKNTLKVAASGRWIYHSMLVGINKAAARIKEWIEDWIMEIKTRAVLAIKDSKRTFRKLAGRLKMNFEKSGSSELRMVNSGPCNDISSHTLINAAFRTTCVANISGCLTKFGKTKIPESKRVDNMIAAAIGSAALESVLPAVSGRVADVYGTLVNALSYCMTAVEAVCWILDKCWTMEIGGVCFTVGASRRNKLVASGIGKVVGGVKTRVKIISVENTGLILVRGTSMRLPEAFLYVIELGLTVYELIQKKMLELELGEMMKSIWQSIKKRNEMPDNSARRLKAVPCFDVVAAYPTILMLGTTIAVAVRMAKRRTEISTATIAVLSERKHTSDSIILYSEDRAAFNYVSRACCLGYGTVMAISGGPVVQALGAVCIMLGAVDVMTEKSNSLGYCFSLSHVIIRVATARSKTTALLSGISAWFYGRGAASDLVNTVVITSMSNARSRIELMGAEKVRSLIREAIKVGVEKERMANIELMDKNKDAINATNAASRVILGKELIKSEEFDGLWEMDYSYKAELVDLDAIVSPAEEKGHIKRESMEHEIKVTELRCEDLFVNQCRYLGRSKKFLSVDKLGDDDYEDKQKSVQTIDPKLWEGIAKPEDFEGYEAAKDSRLAVIFALAERNDMPIVFPCLVEKLEDIVEASMELIQGMVDPGIMTRNKLNGVDWVTLLKTTNEKSTSGIVTRMRSGNKLTAAELAFNHKKIDLCRENLIDDRDQMDAELINVFAKRRIEKVKKSRITGRTCVITRTIQASECSYKCASIDPFVIFDKVMKLKRTEIGLAVGLNFFLEYARDDTRIRGITMPAGNARRIRVSLDHSSFDGSQRVWGMELCCIIRKLVYRRMDLLAGAFGGSESKLSKIFDKLIDRCYNTSRIRMMITPSGDMLVTTGQQMSGHATTSSDNSMRAYIYAAACLSGLKKRKNIRMIKGSLRVQGDDTKFDIMLPREMTDNEAVELISSEMYLMGQVAKPEKMIITNADEECSFLSHVVRDYMFLMGNLNGEKWLEVARCPSRDSSDIVAMLARTLKTGTEARYTGKKKGDISKLASKSMSFLIMYMSNAKVACVCITMIWICFKVLTAYKAYNHNFSLDDRELPWLAKQSGLEGEFRVDLIEIMRMHGVSKDETRSFPVAWVMENEEEADEIKFSCVQLLNNAKKVFPNVKRWNEGALISSMAKAAIGERTSTRLWTINIIKVNELLQSVKDTLKVSISSKSVGYQPFLDLKDKVMKGYEKKESPPAHKIYIMPEFEKNSAVYIDMIQRVEGDIMLLKPGKVGRESKEGISLLVDGVTIVKTRYEDKYIYICGDEMRAKTVAARPWDIIKVNIVGKASVDGVIRSRAESRGLLLGGDRILVDAYSLNRISNEEAQIIMSQNVVEEGSVGVRKLSQRIINKTYRDMGLRHGLFRDVVIIQGESEMDKESRKLQEEVVRLANLRREIESSEVREIK